MTAKDRYKIALNIVAKLGVDNEQLLGEYARTMASLNGLESFNSMQTQFPQMGQNPMPVASPQSTGGMIAPEPTQGVGQPVEGLQTP